VRGRGAREGFSLVEVALLSVFLLIALGGLSSAVISSLKLSRTSEETSIADDAARRIAGELQTVNFSAIFSTYNANPDDDPNGLPGTAPGAAFDVRGLAPRADDPDGRVGRLVFPSVDLGAGEVLREDVVDPRLGMEEGVGRDLNGNGETDDDVTDDYAILPVRIVLEWTGAGGNRSHELDLLLVP
jgi:hypothetical protein